MYASILPVLRCPHCGSGFELTESEKDGEEIVTGKIVCGKGHSFSIREGILDFQSQEQELFNSWSEYSKEESDDSLDRKFDASKTENQRKIEQDFLDDIVEETAKLEGGLLLDVASGRGLLLRKLLENADANVEIISADLSFHVLRHDRRKFRQINPRVKVNYIACDATNLPIQNHSIDMVCTYVGFANMMNLMEKGIRDAARVLKVNAPLINSSVYIDENAEGTKRVAEYLVKNHVEDAEKTFFRKELLAIHKKYFRTVREKIITEGIAEPVEGDLIPCAGEWFANAVLIAE